MRNIEIVKQPDGFLRPPDYVDAVVLAAGIAQQHTVPATVPLDASFVILSANCDFYAAYGADPVASIPAGHVADGTACELNPTNRFVKGTAKIGLISPTGGVVTLSFYRS